jgi:thiosulfate/3-mercaptopyruvate sulfurtransferase
MPYTTLIDSDALAAHLTDGSLVVVDCRFDLANPGWGEQAYAERHIPRAVYAHLDRDLSGVKTGRNGRHPLPDPAALAGTLGRFGIDQDVQVVAYDQDAGMYASRLWWELRWLGHDRVAVLDGGFAKWIQEGKPTSDRADRPSPRVFTARPRADMVADVAAVDALRSRADSRLVDARAPDRFRGESETIDRVAGHIPGAVNHFFKENLDAGGVFLPPEALRDRLAHAVSGVDPHRIVSYCGSGVTACHNLLALEHAGVQGAKLYPGSWSEWSSDPARPTAGSDDG